MEAIIKAWEEERKSPNLASLPTDITEQFQSERTKLKEQATAAPGSIERRMAEIALQRLDFCLQDLFQLRKEKLLLATSRGDEIDTDSLLPWEQQYYAEIRRIEYFYKQNVTTPISIIPSQQAPVQTEEKSNLPRDKSTENPVIPPETTKQNLNFGGPEPLVTAGQETGNYIPIRFLQAEGSIIGVDMREYGPFETGEIVYLPEVHARIFITNGVARQIFPSE